MHRTVSFITAAAWLIAASAAYYLLYPFLPILAGLPRLAAPRLPLAALKPLFCLVFFLVAANGWGSVFFRRIAGVSRLERLVFATGTGLGLMSLAVLVLLAAGFLNVTLYSAVLLAGVVLFLVFGDRSRLNISREHGLAALLSLIPLAGTLIGALAPPTQFDSLVYHLALPARYLGHGGMYAVPHNLFFSFPQNTEMLFLMGMRTNGDILANLIAWSFFPLTALAVYAFSRRFWGTSVALTAAVVWLFTPGISFLATGTYIDLALAFYVFLCAYSLLLASGAGSRFWVAAAGVFGGLALGTKYTAAAAVIPALCLVPVLARPRRAFSDTLLFTGGLLLLFAPWLVKNLLFLHNPVAPWGTMLFTHSLISPAIAADYFAHIQGHGIPLEGISSLLTLPWKLTAYGFRYGGGFDLPGPVFLLFIPVLFFTLKIDKITGILLVVSAAYAAVWLSTGKVLRFLVPVFPFLCIFAAQGFVSCTGVKWLKYAAFAVLAVALAHNLLLFHWTMAPVDPYSVVFGAQSRDEYLARKLDYYPAAHTALASLPAGAKVLSWGETRSYYCPQNTVTPTVFDPHPLAAWANASSSYRSLAALLRHDGFTHIFVNDNEAGRLNRNNALTPAGKGVWEGFLSRCTRTVYQDAHCRIYEITH